MNRQIKDFALGGRPEMFSVTAAKGLLMQAMAAFEQIHGKKPEDRLKSLIEAVEAATAAAAETETTAAAGATTTTTIDFAPALGPPPPKKRRGPQKGSVTSWTLWAKEWYAREKRVRNVSNQELMDPALKRRMASEYHALSADEKQLLRLRARGVAAEEPPPTPPLPPPAGPGPRLRPGLGGGPVAKRGGPHAAPGRWALPIVLGTGDVRAVLTEQEWSDYVVGASGQDLDAAWKLRDYPSDRPCEDAIPSHPMKAALVRLPIGGTATVANSANDFRLACKV